MATGKVKWFNNAKGYGFILPDDTDGDLFAHYSSIQMEGYRTLKAGQAVTFDIIDGEKGSHAVNIAPIIEEAEASDKPQPTETKADTSEPVNDHIETV